MSQLVQPKQQFVKRGQLECLNEEPAAESEQQSYEQHPHHTLQGSHHQSSLHLLTVSANNVPSNTVTSGQSMNQERTERGGNRGTGGRSSLFHYASTSGAAGNNNNNNSTNSTS